MSNRASEDLASVDSGDRKDDQGVQNVFKAPNISNLPALSSKPRISLPTNMVELGEHARDSGCDSTTSTPDPKDTAIQLRNPGQISSILRTNLCISNKNMDPETKRRFVEVQLEIEKLLLEFMCKLRLGPGRCQPIVIRPVILGRTDSDSEAESYMIVICSENIKHKVQDFFDEPLVKSLCEPGDDDVPSFKTLVIGHTFRLRAPNSDSSVQCGPMHRFVMAQRRFVACLSVFVMGEGRGRRFLVVTLHQLMKTISFTDSLGPHDQRSPGRDKRARYTAGGLGQEGPGGSGSQQRGDGGIG